MAPLNESSESSLVNVLAAASSSDRELRDATLRVTSENPAVQRLQRRLRAGAESSEVITSYDRMHHRHNRS